MFRWDNGETREAEVESLEDGDRGSCSDSTTTGSSISGCCRSEGGSVVQVRETAPSWSTALELRAMSACAIR